MKIKEYWAGLRSHKRAALAIAVIVALADTVIVYDMWLAGTWLTNGWLSGFKTAAFVILFIGSLIAEMQELQKRTRWLLFAGVVLLGSYQATVNVVANYHGANVPTEVLALFTPHLSTMQVQIWYAVIDGLVRTTVVIIMWLVTGLVWRGLATSDSVSGEEVASLQAELASVQADRDALQASVAGMQADLSQMKAVAHGTQVFDQLEPEMKARVLAQCRNGDGPTNQQIADWLGVSGSTVGRWLRKE